MHVTHFSRVEKEATHCAPLVAQLRATREAAASDTARLTDTLKERDASIQVLEKREKELREKVTEALTIAQRRKATHEEIISSQNAQLDAANKQVEHATARIKEHEETIKHQDAMILTLQLEKEIAASLPAVESFGSSKRAATDAADGESRAGKAPKIEEES